MTISALRYNSDLSYLGATRVRGVAQPGSVLAWGARGREFESRRPDQLLRGLQNKNPACCRFLLLKIVVFLVYFMVFNRTGARSLTDRCIDFEPPQ